MADTDQAPTRPTSPPGTWLPAKRAVLAFTQPIQRILAVEASSGLLLLASTVVALVFANTALHDGYHALWHTPIGLRIGEWGFEQPLHFWINDGLMTIFFFVVGLEIRREIHEGELATLKQASLPLVAALGGMVAPALIYTALNAGKAGSAGWAIPMATDIAFAVGILTLLGSRVPNAWRILLLALAVIDDLGAIVVIAVFYSSNIALEGFLVAGIGVLAAMAMRAAAIRSPLLYIAPGLVLWIGLYQAGVHPTLAGVILGMLTPVRPWFGPSGFAETTQEHLQDLDPSDRQALLGRLDAIERARREAVSPAERLVHALHPFVAYGIMPLFALANAGVSLGGAELSGDATYVFLGVALGLALGKPIGIAGASLLASKAGVATRSATLTLKGLSLVGIVGGIGFTMSLFIAQLAFPSGPLLETAKLAILVGSGAAMLFGFAFGGVALRAAKP